MADIQVPCPSCGKIATVSEFAKLHTVICRQCGQPLRAIEAEPAKPAFLDFTGEKPPEPNTVIAAVRPLERRRFKLSHQLTSWLAFLVLGGLLCGLRFGGVLSADARGLIAAAAPVLYLAIAIYVVFKAFRESVFEGTLCLFAPFYWIYYLFIKSDDYIARAVLGGVLAAIAWDAVPQVIALTLEFIPAMNEFLQRGVMD